MTPDLEVNYIIAAEVFKEALARPKFLGEDEVAIYLKRAIAHPVASREVKLLLFRALTVPDKRRERMQAFVDAVEARYPSAECEKCQTNNGSTLPVIDPMMGLTAIRTELTK